MTAKMDLAASRNIAWAPTIDIFYSGAQLPLTGATIAMQLRLYPGAPGAPMVNLPAVSFFDLAPADGDARRCLRLFPGIDLSTLGALPTGLNTPEPGEADAYAYDIVLTYADGAADKLAMGSFILEPGVTR